jgi:hypothetical protein
VYFENAHGKVGFTTVITESVTIYQPTRLSYERLVKPMLRSRQLYHPSTITKSQNQQARLVLSINLRTGGFKVRPIDNTGREEPLVVMVKPLKSR